MSTNHLAHFGVKGMHWGVRKNPQRAAAKAEKKWVKKNTSSDALVAVYNATAQRMNDTEVPRINNKPQYRNQDFTHDSPLRDKYYDEYNKTFEKIMNEESPKILGSSPGGQKVSFTTDPETGEISFHVNSLKHSDDSDVKFIGETDENGYIVSIRTADTAKHFGVKGMHWGVRNAESKAREKRAGITGPTEVTKKIRPGKLVKTSGGAHHGPHEDALRIAETRQKARKSSTDSLSTKDLQELVNRMNLEQQYIRLKANDPHNMSDITRILKQASGLGKVANEVTSFARSPAGKAIGTALKSGVKK